MIRHVYIDKGHDRMENLGPEGVGPGTGMVELRSGIVGTWDCNGWDWGMEGVGHGCGKGWDLGPEVIMCETWVPMG